MYKVKILKNNLKLKNKMKQVNLGLYQVGSTATQRETNPADLVAHYLTVLPLRVRKKRNANNSNTVHAHNGGNTGIVILRVLYEYFRIKQISNFVSDIES